MNYIGNMDSLSDDKLILKMRQGDSAAFRALVERYQYRLLVYCFTYTGNEADAEDLAQEIITQIYLKQSKYRPQGLFSHWLFKLAKNHCLNHLRKCNRKLEQLICPLTAEMAENLKSSASSPANLLVANQMQHELEGTMSALEPDERKLLQAHFIKQIPVPALARNMGIPASTLYKRISSIIQKLRKK
ncbi:RNA polymerase sigma factor [Planctomycetota bacterium]